MQKAMKTLGAMALIIAVPASAGEVTGTGESTPVRDYQAASICSFSGLQDDPIAPGSVQSYGMIVRAFGGGKLPFVPGVTCRP